MKQKMQRFAGKVVIVTGASSGIGRETAKAFAQAGANVVLAARRKDRLEDVARGIREQGGVAHVIATDVRDAASIERLISETVTELGRLDILVNNAGYAIQDTLENIDIEEARRLFDVNFFAVVTASKAALPYLRETRGVIINVASVAGLIPMPLNAMYSASKYAVVGFGESLAYELREKGVRVVSVCPGPVNTEFVDTAVGMRFPASEIERFQAAVDKPETIARGILRAARRNYSGTVLPSLRSALPRWAYRIFGPVARMALRAYVRRLHPRLVRASETPAQVTGSAG
jgi:short-subunit dehydrogenase